MSSEKYLKSSRLLTKGDFAHLKSNSSISKSKWLMAFYKEGLNNSRDTRVGISASRKVGNAVKRNRVKRQIREFFRKSEFKSLGKDILVVVHPKFYKEDSVSVTEKINNSMNQIFSRIPNG